MAKRRVWLEKSISEREVKQQSYECWFSHASGQRPSYAQLLITVTLRTDRIIEIVKGGLETNYVKLTRRQCEHLGEDEIIMETPSLSLERETIARSDKKVKNKKGKSNKHCVIIF